MVLRNQKSPMCRQRTLLRMDLRLPSYAGCRRSECARWSIRLERYSTASTRSRTSASRPTANTLPSSRMTIMFDDRGTIVILRSTGEKVITSPIFESEQGLVWTRAGDEVWTTSPLESGEIHAFSFTGKLRVPLAVPGRLQLHDIAPNGALLVAQGIDRRGIVVSTEDRKVERDLSWLDFSYARAISRDGKMILFEEEGNESQNYTVYVRNVDGSPAVPIGDGYGMALSPDNNWVLAEKLTEPTHQVWLLPVGPGEARRISPANLSPRVAAKFFSDGKRIVYVAQDGTRPLRTWLQD